MVKEPPRETAVPGADASAMDEAAFHAAFDGADSAAAEAGAPKDGGEAPPLTTAAPEGPVLETVETDLDQPADDEPAPPSGEKKAEPEPKPETPPKPEDQGKPRNRKTARERIAELNAKVHAERAEREALERRVQELQQAPRPQAPAAPASAPTQPAPQATAEGQRYLQNPEIAEIERAVASRMGPPPTDGDARYYDKDGNFLRDKLEADRASYMTARTLEVQSEVSRRQESRARQLSAADRFKQEDAAYASQHEDYAKFAPVVGRMLIRQDGTAANPELLHAVVEGGGGPKLLHALVRAVSEDPAAAENITRLRGMQLGMYLAHWQAKLDSSLAQPKRTATRVEEPARGSLAPEPLPHTVSGTGVTMRKPVDKMSTEEYMEAEGMF